MGGMCLQVISDGYPRGRKELLGALSRFGPTETADWFRDEGVVLKTEADGRMFPVTDDSQTIIDALGISFNLPWLERVKWPGSECC